MEYANNLKQEATLLGNRVMDAIEANLKRIGRDHSEDDEEPLGLFVYGEIYGEQLTGIKVDGTLVGASGTIRGALEDEQISLDDAISLLEDLEQI
jgi:hypothetical protein